MSRVLLVQPSLQPPGGANAVAAWFLQALVASHHVTTLTWQPVDVGPINRFFGTSLRPSDFDTIVVPRSWTAIPDGLPVPASLLKSSLLMRYTRRVSDAHDVIVGVDNEADYGRRGIQYIHHPTYLRPRPEADMRWYHRPRSALGLYYALADRVSGFSLERLKANVSLANSDWTAARVRALLGIDVRTLYPPVADPAPAPPWSERARRFLAVGRISPEKELERVIRIVAGVRRHAPGVTLTIVGTPDRHAGRYGARVRREAAAHGPWIDFRHDVAHDELRRLMAASRYGIHGMREEHFGMAPAEMARAGMLVWVPDGGGQVEITGDPALAYATEEEAIDRIAATIAAPARERELSAAIAARTARLSPRNFMEQVRREVEEFRE
ncbi:MAG: glycosyltransferase family 4 protein [Vicinamibacterales bacterium]